MIKRLALIFAGLAAALTAWVFTDADIPVPTPSGWIVIGAPRLAEAPATPPSAQAIASFHAYTSGQNYLYVAGPEAIFGNLESISADCLSALDERAHQFGARPQDISWQLPPLPSPAEDSCRAAPRRVLLGMDTGQVANWVKRQSVFDGPFTMRGFESGAWMTPKVRAACARYLNPKRLNLDWTANKGNYGRLWCG